MTSALTRIPSSPLMRQTTAFALLLILVIAILPL